MLGCGCGNPHHHEYDGQENCGGQITSENKSPRAGDGASALAILRKEQPVDLLITDVGLPGMNGRQLSEIARKLRPNLKVLFVTGYAGTEALKASELTDGIDVLAKPFAFAGLSDKILTTTVE